jgi:hypothetical protein
MRLIYLMDFNINYCFSINVRHIICHNQRSGLLVGGP